LISTEADLIYVGEHKLPYKFSFSQKIITVLLSYAVVCTSRSLWSISPFSFLSTVDGRYGEWEAWGPCDKECGYGMKTRTRSCNNPRPAGGGRQCTGQKDQRSRCRARSCRKFIIDNQSRAQVKWNPFWQSGTFCGSTYHSTVVVFGRFYDVKTARKRYSNVVTFCTD